jgi:hypothetical protein
LRKEGERRRKKKAEEPPSGRVVDIHHIYNALSQTLFSARA